MGSNGTTYDHDYDWEKDLSELMSTKSGVKGLVDSGILKIPKMFVSSDRNHLKQANSDNDGIENQVPIINLEGYESKRRMIIVNEVLEASRKWGMFQVINHGVQTDVMMNMLESVCDFHEQAKEMKEEYYSHDSSRKVWYYATIHPVLRAAFWKDTIACEFENLTADFEALPKICRFQLVTLLLLCFSLTTENLYILGCIKY